MTTLCHTEAATQKKTLMETSLLHLMSQRPYQEITVMDICREAEVPRRTFYHYFGNKEDVLESVIESLMQQCFLEVIFDIRLGKEYMEQCFATIFRFWTGENRKKLDILMKNGLELRLLSWASQWIRREQISSLQKSNLDPKLVEIGLMVGITDFFTLLFHWSRGGYRESVEQMAEYAVWVLPHAFYNL